MRDADPEHDDHAQFAVARLGRAVDDPPPRAGANVLASRPSSRPPAAEQVVWVAKAVEVDRSLGAPARASLGQRGNQLADGGGEAGQQRRRQLLPGVEFRLDVEAAL